jgi:hypothetical protein
MKGDSMISTTAKHLGGRGRVIHISFSERELQLLQQISESYGMKETDTIRELIRAEARREGQWPEETAKQP